MVRVSGSEISPRNLVSKPDQFEARVLRKIKSENLFEYYEIDPSTNSIRYFRPIRLTQECMLCHGDPSTSEQPWGNDQGLEKTRTCMENWKVGKIHGAFKVIYSLDATDRELSSTIWKGIVLVVSVGVVSLILFGALIERSKLPPLNGVMTAISRIVRGDVTTSVAIVSDDEFGQLTEAFDEVVDYMQEMATATEEMTATIAKISTSTERAREVTGTAVDTVGLTAQRSTSWELRHSLSAR